MSIIGLRPWSFEGTPVLVAASSFSPSSLSANGWYDPSDITTLWKDTAGTTPVTADGDLVARIDDKSGNGRNLTQATSGLRPLYKTSGGLHWLDFDGADDFLSGAAITNFIAPSAYECCVGFRADTIGTNVTTTVYGNEAVWGDAGAFASGGYLRNNGNAGTVGTAGTVGAYNWDTNVDKAENIYTVGDDGVISQRHESGNLYIRLNSLTEASAASGNTGSVLSALNLGRESNNSTQCMDGRVYGFVIKNAVLTTQQRSDLRTWMAAKSGVAL